MPDSLNHFQQLGIAGSFAGVCGGLSYALGAREGKKFSWIDFGLNIFVSAACGLIAFEILESEGFVPQLAGALCGIAGFVGTTLVKFARTFAQAKSEQIVEKVKEGEL